MNEKQVFELADKHLGHGYNRGRMVGLINAAEGMGVSLGARMVTASYSRQAAAIDLAKNFLNELIIGAYSETEIPEKAKICLQRIAAAETIAEKGKGND
jgi:PHP family Zn ribbon phosphoesterase